MVQINNQVAKSPFVGTGGGIEAQQYYAGRDFKELFGRDATPQELAMLSSAYDSGDKNIAGVSAGKSAVAQYYQSQENTPDKQFAKQQSQYAADAPKFHDQISQMFQGSLGRDATKEEKDHFGSLLASGQVDPYTVQQFLQALPENVQKQDKAFRENLSTELQGQDARYFNEQVMPGVQSAFANQGRDVRSTGFGNSLALAAQGQNRQRESFLSNLTAQQYQGSQANARQDYLGAYGQYTGLQDYSRNRSAQMQDASIGRVNELQNFAIQRQQYDEYLRKFGKRSQGQAIGSLAGGLVGAGAGAFFGGPAGAQMGYTMGSGVGGATGSMF